LSILAFQLAQELDSGKIRFELRHVTGKAGENGLIEARPNALGGDRRPSFWEGDDLRFPPLAGDPENFDRVFVGREAGQPHDCLGECFEFHVVSGNKKAPGDTSPLAGRKHPAGAVGESHRGVPR